MATEEERTFNEAMNEWATKQSFFQDTRNRLIHPDPSLPWIFRMLGYVFRIAVVCLLLWLISAFLLNRYVKGEGFGEMIGEKTAALLDAEEFESRSFNWKDNRATTKLFKATGADKAFYKELTAYGVAFEMPSNRLFKEAWQLDNLRVGELDILLRVGRKSETASNMSQDLPLISAGFGIDPDFGQLEFEDIEIDDGTFRWGVSSSNRGELTKAPIVATPPSDGADGWTLDIKGGALSQNWWRNMAIETLKVQTSPDRITFSDSKFNLSPSGTGSLSGNIALGAVPIADLQLNLASAATESLCPTGFQRHLGGTLNASIGIKGSPNTRAGFSANATVEILEAKLREILVFEALSMFLESSRIRHLPITGGTLSLETGGGVLKVTDIDVASEGIGRMTGSFTLREAKDEAAITSNDLGSMEAAARIEAKGPSTDKTDWVFDGLLRFGVDTAKFPQVNAPEAAGIFTKDTGEGLTWLDIPLEGNIEEITKPLHDRIVAAYQARRR